MGADTLSGAIQNFFWFLGDITFAWVPATVVSVGNSVSTSTAPTVSPISRPVTPFDAFTYLQQNASAQTYSGFYHGWIEYSAFSIVFSIFLGVLVGYCIMRILEVRRHERERFEILEHTVAARDIPKTQLRWNRIIEEVNSEDDKRWRVAILEADIMLNELLDVLGYRGETMGDKMKQVDRANFHTIDLAWEAHKIRNAIAHEGSAHMLSAREARRVIGLYEQVFREFKFLD